MATPAIQRTYSAPCPGCGAPVEFRSAQSTHAVCPYCQSTVLRQGETLARIGRMAELFDDFSPLQLHTAGVFAGRKFTLLGRLQYQYAQGTWTEWYALFDEGSGNGSSDIGYLSEDNGAYVFTLPTTLERPVPPAENLRLGATTAINGKSFSVASNQQVSLLSAQGELPHLPPLGTPFGMAELRSADGEVLSIDYAAGAGTPVLSLGRAVLLDDLRLTGLREASAKSETGTQFACPNCGAPVVVALATSQSITCPSCHSIIDLTQGTGAALRHAIQDEPVTLLIPLGTTGKLQGADWQVVGFQHRMGQEPDATEDGEDDDESFGWSEYLLYNRQRGFVFLVDSEEGWSLVKPATGAPTFKPGAQSVSYLNTSYRLLSSYNAVSDYVAGEFYWRVERGEKTFNRDFANGHALLSQEQSGAEITWSSGNKLDGDTVASAFKLDANKKLFKRSDAAPLSSASGVGCGTIVTVGVLILILLLLFTRCSSCDPKVENCSSSGSSRTSGGSFGGFSGGGGHK